MGGSTRFPLPLDLWTGDESDALVRCDIGDNAEVLRDKRRGVKAVEDVRENWQVIGRAGARGEVPFRLCTIGGRGGADSCTAGAGVGGSEGSLAGGDEGRTGDRRDPDEREPDAAICARIFAIVLMVLRDEELR